MESFPTVQILADAQQDEVLKHWSGLGYYARARNIHDAAKMVCNKFNGDFPQDLETMQSLKGVGRSTAAAILSIASHQAEPILDGNVKRVLSRVFAVEGWPGKSDVSKKLWALAEKTTPTKRNADYTQAIMDLGATLCTRSNPQCLNCPLQEDCIAYKDVRQADFPGKKPKKVLPERHTIMLILRNQDKAILMQKRPPVGIWGGLWCFPQFERIGDAEQWLHDYSGEELEVTEELAVLSHAFSHFRLHIQPLIFDTKTPINLRVMENEDSLWYNIHTEFNGGLAAPVTTLLNNLVIRNKG
jgi:A/G-specific adenine glycosylase